MISEFHEGKDESLVFIIERFFIHYLAPEVVRNCIAGSSYSRNLASKWINPRFFML